jgi:hypothetical protein
VGEPIVVDIEVGIEDRLALILIVTSVVGLLLAGDYAERLRTR